MGVVGWMCGVELQDRVPSKELREGLGLDDMISVLQQNRLWWYGHVLRKEDNDWVKNVWSMKWRVPGQEVDQGKLGERLWKKTVRHVKWTGRMPRIVIYGGSTNDHNRCEWVNVSSGTASSGLSWTKSNPNNCKMIVFVCVIWDVWGLLWRWLDQYRVTTNHAGNGVMAAVVSVSDAAGLPGNISHWTS